VAGDGGNDRHLALGHTARDVSPPAQQLQGIFPGLPHHTQIETGRKFPGASRQHGNLARSQGLVQGTIQFVRHLE